MCIPLGYLHVDGLHLCYLAFRFIYCSKNWLSNNGQISTDDKEEIKASEKVSVSREE